MTVVIPKLVKPVTACSQREHSTESFKNTNRLDLAHNKQSRGLATLAEGVKQAFRASDRSLVTDQTRANLPVPAEANTEAISPPADFCIPLFVPSAGTLCPNGLILCQGDFGRVSIVLLGTKSASQTKNHHQQEAVFKQQSCN